MNFPELLRAGSAYRDAVLSRRGELNLLRPGEFLRLVREHVEGELTRAAEAELAGLGMEAAGHGGDEFHGPPPSASA